MLKIVSAALSVAVLSGCAGAPPPLPDAQDAAVRIVARPEPDYLGQFVIPNSQVIVSMPDRLALAGHEGAFMIRADYIVADRLRAAQIAHVASDDPALIVLIPKVRLERHGDQASIACVLEADYSAGGMATSFVHRVYRYPISEPRPLIGHGNGWSDNEGATFHSFVQSAFAKLTDDFTADWRKQSRPAPRGG